MESRFAFKIPFDCVYVPNPYVKKCAENTEEKPFCFHCGFKTYQVSGLRNVFTNAMIENELTSVRMDILDMVNSKYVMEVLATDQTIYLYIGYTNTLIPNNEYTINMEVIEHVKAKLITLTSNNKSLYDSSQFILHTH